VTVQRARKIQRFLSQPFHVAEQFTGAAGRYVKIADTVKGFQAIVEGKIDEAGLNPAERALLDYVKLITDAAYRSTAEDVQKLRDLGWKEDQIAEAVYITAMFAFFNRVADAVGVPSQDYLGTGKVTP